MDRKATFHGKWSAVFIKYFYEKKKVKLFWSELKDHFKATLFYILYTVEVMCIEIYLFIYLLQICWLRLLLGIYFLCTTFSS